MKYRNPSFGYQRIAEAESALQLRRNYPVARFSLGTTYLDMGRVEEAIEQHEMLRDNYYWSFALAATLAAAGRTDEALQISRKYEKAGNSMVLVLIYASMGDYDNAYKWMLSARDDKIPWYPWLLKWYPQTRGIHHDPRVLALAEELGL